MTVHTVYRPQPSHQISNLQISDLPNIFHPKPRHSFSDFPNILYIAPNLASSHHNLGYTDTQYTERQIRQNDINPNDIFPIAILTRRLYEYKLKKWVEIEITMNFC